MPVSGIKVQPSDQSLKNGVNYFSMPLVVFFKNTLYMIVVNKLIVVI